MIANEKFFLMQFYVNNVIDEFNTSVTTKVSLLVLHYTGVKVGSSPT